jgi:hypothetical protein
VCLGETLGGRLYSGPSTASMRFMGKLAPDCPEGPVPAVCLALYGSNIWSHWIVTSGLRGRTIVFLIDLFELTDPKRGKAASGHGSHACNPSTEEAEVGGSGV